jgi:hypothetical protein
MKTTDPCDSFDSMLYVVDGQIHNSVDLDELLCIVVKSGQ